jgi:hypothetical protein
MQAFAIVAFTGAAGLMTVGFASGDLMSTGFAVALVTAFGCGAIFDAVELAIGIRCWGDDFCISFFWVETAAVRCVPADFTVAGPLGAVLGAEGIAPGSFPFPLCLLRLSRHFGDRLCPIRACNFGALGLLWCARLAACRPLLSRYFAGFGLRHIGLSCRSFVCLVDFDRHRDALLTSIILKRHSSPSFIPFAARPLYLDDQRSCCDPPKTAGN